jgi:hypothetical protein
MCLSAFFIYCRILRSEIRKGGLGLQTVSASEILIETRFVCQGFQPGRLLKKLHMLRYARPTRFNLLKRTPQLIELRVPRLWIFLSSLQPEFFSHLPVVSLLRGGFDHRASQMAR